MTDGDRRAIRVDYDFGIAPEMVWRALSEPELLEQWLMPNDIAPKIGHRFTFHTQPAPGFDGVIRCEVTEAEPPRRLAYSWQSGPVETFVTWTFELTAAGGTRLSLIQDGFGPEHGWIYEMLEKGWRERSGSLLKQLVASL